MNEGPIARSWSDYDGRRMGILETARECAKLSVPWVLPPQGQMPDQKLPTNSQSMGSRGVANMTGKLLLSSLPPDRPWVQQVIAPEIWYDPTVPADWKQALQQKLYLQDMVLMALLEQPPDSYDRRCYGIYANTRRSYEQLVATGDTLEFMDADYQLHIKRRDNYITERDSSGRVVGHITRDMIDPVMELTPEQFAKTKLNGEELGKKTCGERKMPLYTRCWWQPRSKTWLIEQEFHGTAIVSGKTEKVSPYFATAYTLSPEENYGRGLVELNQGDLSHFDKINEHIVDFAAMCAKFIPVLDENSLMSEEDLCRRSGVVVRGKLNAEGQPRDFGFAKVDKTADFSVVGAVRESLRKDLGAAFLIESESVRNSERTTAFEVSQVTLKELEGNEGGVGAMILDQRQGPMFRRLQAQAVANGHLKPIDEDVKNKAVRTKVLTGLAALANRVRAQGVLRFTQVAAQLEQVQVSVINKDTLLDVYARYEGVAEPGLIKTREEQAADTQRALAVQAQAQAQETAITTAGEIAKQQIGVSG